MEKSKRDVKPSAFAISLRQNGSVFLPSRGVKPDQVFNLHVMERVFGFCSVTASCAYVARKE
jgi:hypothetical protein